MHLSPPRSVQWLSWPENLPVVLERERVERVLDVSVLIDFLGVINQFVEKAVVLEKAGDARYLCLDVCRDAQSQFSGFVLDADEFDGRPVVSLVEAAQALYQRILVRDWGGIRVQCNFQGVPSAEVRSSILASLREVNRFRPSVSQESAPRPLRAPRAVKAQGATRNAVQWQHIALHLADRVVNP